MYQRHAFGAPPPVFTPPPAPYNPKHQAYATQARTPITHPTAQPSPPSPPPPPDQDGGFPAHLSPATPQYNKPLPVPAIDFSSTTGQSVADLFNKEMKIYVSPTDYFTTIFWKDFQAPQDQGDVFKVRETVDQRPQHGLLAAAAELCCMVRNHRLWRLS